LEHCLRVAESLCAGPAAGEDEDVEVGVGGVEGGDVGEDAGVAGAAAGS